MPWRVSLPAGHKLVHSRALWGRWLCPLFRLLPLPPLGKRKEGGSFGALATGPVSCLALAEDDVALLISQRGEARED